MFGGAYRDAKGRSLPYQEFLQAIRGVYRGAIFSFQAHGLGRGVLGGKVVSHFEQGKVAASLASRVLRGGSVASIPVVSQSPNVVLFDYREMRRLGLNRNDLPENAQILNESVTVLDTNPFLVIGGTSFVLLQSGIIVFLVFTVRRRRRAEADMREAVRSADQANAAKTDFLSRMSHELRTPLNSIIGFGQLIETAPPTLTPEVRREYASYIVRGGKQLLELINEVLDFAKIEAGHCDLSIMSFDPAVVISESLGLIQSSAIERGITVDPFNGLDGLYSVSGDQVRFRQVVLNLLSNAVKYNRDGGRVTMTAERQKGGCVRFTVIDTGNGLAADSIAGLFEPFDRLGEEYGEVEGTGIGLTISKKLVELMGGAIGAESTLGYGSAFWFELPVGDAAVSVTTANPAVFEAGDEVVSPSANRDVLYIEDNKLNTRLLEAMFEELAGYRLRTVTSGEQGIEAARRRRPDIILLDINLPGIDGIETAAEMRRDAALRDVPIIAVSANAIKTEIDRAYAAGCDFYITKPVDLSTLRRALFTWQAGRDRAVA